MNRVIRKPHSRLRQKMSGSQDSQLPAHNRGRHMVGDCNSNTEPPELQKVDPRSSPTLPDESRTMSPDNSSLVLPSQFLELTESAPRLKSISREQTPIEVVELKCEEPPSFGEKATPIQLQKHPGRDIPRDNDDVLRSRKLVEISPLGWLQLTQPQSPDYFSCIREEPSTVGNTTSEAPHKVQVDIEQSSLKEILPLIADRGVSQEENRQPLITEDGSKNLWRSVQVNYHSEFDIKAKATACYSTDAVHQTTKLNQTQGGQIPMESWLSAVAPNAQASAQKIMRLYSDFIQRVVTFCVEQKDFQDLTIKKLEAHNKAQERMMSDYGQSIAENSYLRSQLRTARLNAAGIRCRGEYSEILWDELQDVMAGFQIDTSANQITHQWMWEENRKRYAALESEEHSLVAKFQALFDILMEERKMFTYAKETNQELKLSPMDTLAIQRLFDDVFFYLQTLRDIEKIERSTLAAFVAKVNPIHVEIKLEDGYLHQAPLPMPGTWTEMNNEHWAQSDSKVECTSHRLENSVLSESESEIQVVNQERMALRGGMCKDSEHMDEAHANMCK